MPATAAPLSHLRVCMRGVHTPSRAAGVMPLILASSVLAVPGVVSRLTGAVWVEDAAAAVGPAGPLYLPASCALIAAFNYYYTFLQVTGGVGAGGAYGVCGEGEGKGGRQ